MWVFTIIFLSTPLPFLFDFLSLIPYSLSFASCPSPSPLLVNYIYIYKFHFNCFKDVHFQPSQFSFLSQCDFSFNTLAQVNNFVNFFFLISSTLASYISVLEISCIKLGRFKILHLTSIRITFDWKAKSIYIKFYITFTTQLMIPCMSKNNNGNNNIHNNPLFKVYKRKKKCLRELKELIKKIIFFITLTKKKMDWIHQIIIYFL